MTKVAIVGSRSYVDSSMEDKIRTKVYEYVEQLLYDIEDIVIVSGGAKGPDTWAEEACDELGIWTTIIEPDWDKYGKAAGFKRNTQIVEESDVVVAFWDGESNGTKDTINKAIDRGMVVNIYVLPHNE